jgi:ribosomal protein L4
MATLEIVDVKGQKAGSVELPAELFDVQTNVPLIHQVVVAQLAAARQGTHKTKTRFGSAGRQRIFETRKSGGYLKFQRTDGVEALRSGCA